MSNSTHTRTQLTIFNHNDDKYILSVKLYIVRSPADQKEKDNLAAFCVYSNCIFPNVSINKASVESLLAIA